MNTSDRELTRVKNQLKEVLETHNGDTKYPEIVKLINDLSALNPTVAPVENDSLLQGNWLLINAPNFPDRQPDKENRYVYRLGRLAFNMFEPINLRVAIERVLQPVFLTDNPREYTHHIVVEFKIIEPNFPPLKGIIKNLAICNPVDKDTVRVQFTGGELSPLDIENTEQMQSWLSIFGSNNIPRSQALSDRPSLTIKDRINSWIIKFMFGISQPTPMDSQTGKRAFVMKKSPKGLLKILYLDEELRITKGKKETVLICQRQ